MPPECQDFVKIMLIIINKFIILGAFKFSIYFAKSNYDLQAIFVRIVQYGTVIYVKSE